MNSTEIKPSWSGYLFGYFILLLLVSILATVVTAECAVAMNARCTAPLERAAMWIGSVSWLIVVLFFLVQTFIEDHDSWWLTAIFGVLCASSFTGLYAHIPKLITFAHWLNAGLWIVFFVSFIVMLWDDLTYKQPQRSQTATDGMH